MTQVMESMRNVSGPSQILESSPRFLHIICTYWTAQWILRCSLPSSCTSQRPVTKGKKGQTLPPTMRALMRVWLSSRHALGLRARIYATRVKDSAGNSLAQSGTLSAMLGIGGVELNGS